MASELVAILEQLANVAKAMDSIDNQLQRDMADTTRQKQDLLLREEQISGIESALAVLNEAKKFRDEAAQLHTDLETKKAEIDNYSRQEMEKVRIERDALLPYQDMKAEVIQDKQKLAEAWAALEKEKKEYEARIRAVLIEHFKAGGK